MAVLAAGSRKTAPSVLEPPALPTGAPVSRSPIAPAPGTALARRKLIWERAVPAHRSARSSRRLAKLQAACRATGPPASRCSRNPRWSVLFSSMRAKPSRAHGDCHRRISFSSLLQMAGSLLSQNSFRAARREGHATQTATACRHCLRVRIIHFHRSGRSGVRSSRTLGPVCCLLTVAWARQDRDDPVSQA